LAWPRNVVMIHDAAEIRRPEWYSPTYARWQRLVLPSICQRAVHVVTPSNFARGEVIGAFALTEPGAGSDAGSLRTSATPNGDGWRIDGAKQWITNGSHAGTFLLFARTDQDQPGGRGVSAFVLDAEHVRVTREEEKLGLNSSSTVDLVVEGAEVGRDRLLHRRSGSRRRRTTSRVRMRSNASSSASASPSSRRSNGSWPTWRRRSMPRACSSTGPRG